MCRKVGNSLTFCTFPIFSVFTFNRMFERTSDSMHLLNLLREHSSLTSIITFLTTFTHQMKRHSLGFIGRMYSA